MSHVVKIATKYKDQGALVSALREVFGHCEVNEGEGKVLDGWWDDGQAPTCPIIVRSGAKHHETDGTLAGTSVLADIGFRRGADGTFETAIDGIDAEKAGIKASLAKLAQRYARNVAVGQAKLAGYTVSEAELPDGQIKLTLKRW